MKARRALAIGATCLGFACGSVAGVRRPAPPHDPGASFLVGAGDIATCGNGTSNETAAIVSEIPGTVFTTGDNAYPDGSLTNYRDCYAPSWGRFRDRTRPSPGNHDYGTPGGSGYFAYFAARAGPPGRGYYSYDIGAWHIVALDSGIGVSDSSPELTWLRNDLASTPRRCLLAYWHRPLFSSGREHGGSPDVAPLWRALYAAGADVVVNGHEHNYERFAPQTPDGRADSTYGIREFVAGTGGADADGFGPPVPNSEFRLSDQPGVLVFALESDGYRWWFIPTRGATYADSGVGECHTAPPLGASATLPPAASRPGAAQ